MQEERLFLGGVPTRRFMPEGAHGLLLLGHGGGHGKDGSRFVGLGRHYAAKTGLSVVCIDAVDHGERRPVAAADGVPRGWHSRAMPQMTADWQAVADHFSSVGPPVAYVGFSMGALFGLSTVASMPSIEVAVFVAGGFPGGNWTDDAELAPLLIAAASELGHAHVLMLNKDHDELFPATGVRQLFECVVARSKRLRFSPGRHDDWGSDVIDASVTFIEKHAVSERNAAAVTTSEGNSAVGDSSDGDGVMVGAPLPRPGAGPVRMASGRERQPRSPGLVEEDLEAVVAACARLPEPEGDYLEDDFLVNLMATVVDFQLQTPAVERALRHFREVVRPGLAGIDDLLGLFDRWPSTKEGNTALAEHLWGYRLWTRAQHLRDLVAYFASVGVRDQEALRAWAQTTSGAEFKGRVKGLGPAVFQWLVMRQGIETVKPDVHVHRFVAAALGRQVSNELAVALVTAAARRLGRSTLRLDWAIWEAGRAGPPSAPPTATEPTPPSPVRARSPRSVAAHRSGDDGAVARFVDDDEGYLAWLDEHPDGFVLNAHRRPKPSYLVLHRASCSSLRAVSRRSTPGRIWTIDFQKACASDAAALVAWARVVAPGEPTPCGRCRPALPDVDPRP